MKNLPFLFLFSILFPLASLAAEEEPTYDSYVISCGHYIEHRRDALKVTGEHTADMYYVAGWLSAYNRVSPTHANFSDDTDLDSILLWLEKYCKDEPLSNVEAGLMQLTKQQAQKAPAADPIDDSIPPVSSLPSTASPHKPNYNLKELKDY